jgi:glycosyltransferase involved in cell wall biosynthesis
MKIIQTPVRFYPYTGGVEKYVLDYSKELVKQEIGVKIICAKDPKTEIREYEGIKIDKLKYLFKIANTNISLGLPFKLWKEDFDIIHTHLPTPWFADWSVIIAKLKRKKSVLTYHNDIVGEGAGGIIAKIYNNTLLKITLKLTDKIIITQEKYLNYSPYLKKYKNKIVIIPNSVDLSRFKKLPEIKKEKDAVFFLSVLDKYHKYKGLDYLLEAIKIVKNNITNVKLIIGGRGELLDYYKNRVKKLNIEDNVKFHGFIPDEKLTEYYNKCEVFILPSIDSKQEGFGIVLIEALACGTPVVTTNIVGMADEIKKYNAGMVVEPKNSKLLAESIIKVLANSEKYTSNIKEIIKKFDIKTNTEKLLSIYKHLND